MTGIWTEARVQRLRTMYEDGASFRTIADDIGVTRCSAIGKAHRLYLPKRPDPSKKKHSPRPLRLPRPPRVRIREVKPPPSPLSRLERALAVATEPGRDYRCTIDELRDGTCRFPLWRWPSSPRLYCGAPGASLSSDRPYCVAHTEFCGGRRSAPATQTHRPWHQNSRRSSAR
jgi:hypothetical protein